MRVIVYPGTTHAEEKDLARVLTPSDVFRNGAPAREFIGALAALLVEKGVLSLQDCMALGAPYMEPAE